LVEVLYVALEACYKAVDRLNVLFRIVKWLQIRLNMKENLPKNYEIIGGK